MREFLIAVFRLPGPDMAPAEIMRWARRWEIVTSVGCLLLALAPWFPEVFRWVLVGVGVLGLVPLLGPARVLRRAKEDPAVLVTDPERRVRRRRRTGRWLVLAQGLTGAVLGYFMEGWILALVMAAVLGGSAAFGAWLGQRRWTRSGS